jgi:hypothetical protein
MSSPAESRFHQIVRAYGATVLPQEAVALNDDLVHLAVVVADDGGHVPAIYIKDLEGLAEYGIVIERAYLPTFIANLHAQEAKLDALTADLDALYEEDLGK